MLVTTQLRQNSKKNSGRVATAAFPGVLDNISRWSNSEKIDIVHSGISKQQFLDFKKGTALDYDDLARILGVTRATLHNKSEDGRFSTGVSEKVLRLAAIFAYGREVFGTNERFSQWLQSDIIALGAHKPIELLDTGFGMDEVLAIIGRIDYGVYS